MHNPLHMPYEATSQLPNVLRATTGMPFFDISTSKSAPNLVHFVHVDLKMCFAPQRCTLFRHLNFQKCSDPGVFCTFWLGDVLRVTTAYTCSTSQLPKVLRPWCVLYMLTWKCASRYSRVRFSTSQLQLPKVAWDRHFFYSFDFDMCFAPQRRAIFHLSSGQMAPHPPLQRAYFSTCRSHKSLDKHSVSRLFYFFARLHLLSSDSFSSLIFSLLLFSSLLFPDCSHLLSTCPNCRKFHF